MADNSQRKNIHFRQTEKEFRSQKQAQIFQHFNTNLPYRIFSFSRRQANIQIENIKRVYGNFRLKLPKNAVKKK